MMVMKTEHLLYNWWDQGVKIIYSDFLYIRLNPGTLNGKLLNHPTYPNLHISEWEMIKVAVIRQNMAENNLYYT